MNTSENTPAEILLTANMKQVLASRLTTLGRFHNEKYVIHRYCLESIKDILRFFRKDNDRHEIRRYLGEAKVVQNDLIHIIKVCPAESDELFQLTIRLLMNLVHPVYYVYRQEVPTDKINRSIYMTIMEQLQSYKEAFSDIDFWSVICGKLTDLFEIDWAERSEDESLQIERLLVLLRNVLHIPADTEQEKVTEDGISLHDKILWSLRQSQILEFLLYVSSNKNEQVNYLALLEIFSLILREQNPKLLAMSEIQRYEYEKEKDMNDLRALREREKSNKKIYRYVRHLESKVILEGVKSFSKRDVAYNGFLTDLKDPYVSNHRKSKNIRGYKVPFQSESLERRSSFSVRIFLKEFCIELLNCSYNNLMSVAKDRLMSGHGLLNDESHYFWALKFFLEFHCTSNLDIKLVSECVNVQAFHFLHANMDENFEKLTTEKKKRALWTKKLHTILKAYYSLLQTLKWMDSSKDASVRSMSDVLKSQIFYVVEYRDIPLYYLMRYDRDIFSVSFVRDLIEATHLFLKLLDDYTKRNNIVIQKKVRRKRKRKVGKRHHPMYESNEDAWERIRPDLHAALRDKNDFPEISPYDVLSELTEEEQKERAMKNVQKLLQEGKIEDGIGLLRSARQVWPENDHFGCDGMSVDDEMIALREICLAELGNEKIPLNDAPDGDANGEEDEDLDENDDSDVEKSYDIKEHCFNMSEYKQHFVNKRIVEACCVLLKNYEKNTDYTNHCVIKLLAKIGWDCKMPAMMYQISLFTTLYEVMNNKHRNYKEINEFTTNLFRKFRKNAMKDKFTFVELLFWKDPSVAMEIQDFNTKGGAEESEIAKKGKKAACWSVEEENELRKLWDECGENWSLKRKLEYIKTNLIDQSKSIKGIRKKLVEMNLVRKKVRGDKTNFDVEWLEMEVAELKDLFRKFHDSADIVAEISKHLTVSRTKKSIKQKLLELGLVSTLGQLRKKRNERNHENHSEEEEEDDEDQDKDENNDNNEDDDEGQGDVIDDYLESNGTKRTPCSIAEQIEALKKVQHMTEELTLLRNAFQDTKNREFEVDENLLIVPRKMREGSFTFKLFTDALLKLGLTQRTVEATRYWIVPSKSQSDLELKLKLINCVLSGEDITNELLEEFQTLGSKVEVEVSESLARKPFLNDYRRRQKSDTDQVNLSHDTVRRRKGNAHRKNIIVSDEEDVVVSTEQEPVDGQPARTVISDDEDNERISGFPRRRRQFDSDDGSDMETNTCVTRSSNWMEEEFEKLKRMNSESAEYTNSDKVPLTRTDENRPSKELEQKKMEAMGQRKIPEEMENGVAAISCKRGRIIVSDSESDSNFDSPKKGKRFRCTVSDSDG